MVDKDRYLLELSRYVHLNPVRAKIADTPQAYRYTSYHAYINDKGDDLIHTGTVLGMISEKGREAKYLYRDFVESAIDNELENPLEKVYGGMVLGNENFIRDVLQRLQDKAVPWEEVSSRKDLRRGLAPQEVLAAVSACFRVDRADLLSDRRSPARKAFVYLLKNYAMIGNREIGEILGCKSASAATKICRVFEGDLEEDAALRKVVKPLMAKFSIFKGRLL